MNLQIRQNPPNLYSIISKYLRETSEDSYIIPILLYKICSAVKLNLIFVPIRGVGSNFFSAAHYVGDNSLLGSAYFLGILLAAARAAHLSPYTILYLPIFEHPSSKELYNFFCYGLLFL